MTLKKLITKENLIPILIVIFVFYYVYTYYNYYNKENNNNIKEDFTPKIRNMYRPYIRNVRIISEGFYNHNNNKINNLFRRFGLY